MKTFIIDGYNVIYKIPQFENKLDDSLQAAREALVDFIRVNKVKTSDYVIVFEGKDEYAGLSPLNTGNVRIIFTKTREEADRRIVDMLKSAASTHDFVIVSDDNYVRNHARAFGAIGMSAEEFFRVKSPKKNVRRDICQSNVKDSQKINEELKKAWGI